METAPSMDEGLSTADSFPGDEADLGMTEKARTARQKRLKGTGRLDNVESEKEKIRILRSQRLLSSLRETGDEIKHIDIAPAVKNREEYEPATGAYGTNSEEPKAASPPAVPTRRSKVEEKRRQLELEKEAFEKMKRNNAQQEKQKPLETMKRDNAQQEKQNHAQREVETQSEPTYDVDDTIDTTQSSEQKFLTLEDVKGILQESRILSCVSDKQAIADIDDGDELALEEEESILAKLKGSLKESLELLTQPSDTLPTEISFSPEAGEEISSQMSFFDKQDEELIGDGPLLQPIREEGNDQAAATADRQLPTTEQEDDFDLEAMPVPPRREPTAEELGRLTKLERKVSEVIRLQAEEETLKKEEERKRAEDQKREDNGIKYLRQKSQARQQLEAAARRKAEQDAEAKWLAEQKENRGVPGENTTSRDINVIQELKSPNALMKLTQPLRRVLTNFYPVAGNEITLEEYEDQVCVPDFGT